MRHNVEDDKIVHKPVMWKEVLKFAGKVQEAGDNIFADCTLGEGGHSKLLLETYKDLRIIAFERDPEILEIAKRRLEEYSGRIEFINDNFADIEGYLGTKKQKLSGFLYDFGISSYHFEKSGRGFSFTGNEPLDMRLDKRKDLNAYYIANKYPENKIREIFWEYGEERWAKRIAKIICERRKLKSIETSDELADIVKSAIPAKFRVRNIHPATRVFQAIRIEVNDELNSIRKSLNDAHKYLATGGMIIAISFHSLEDRIVKDQFRRLAKGCVCGLPPQQCMCDGKPLVEILTKKPFTPSEEELEENRRSRSAKLRACRKV
ncbi:MAG: 16S rRNA (cytosine(1402)-N(4))-methyltransferase RsmH [Spirochaetes bacterium]|nr:16S rRNA (cytosine(1402)-N(4))-methyltransferase RsmH [Spirochaetota bacterium]